MTPEQEEILDSGLRMLAHMIAETHLRRIASKKRDVTTTQSPKVDVEDSSPEGHDE